MLRLIVSFLLLTGSATWACPGCKLLPTDGAVPAEVVREQQRANDSFSWNVLFMLSVPLTLVAAGGVLVVRTCEDADARQARRVK